MSNRPRNKGMRALSLNMTESKQTVSHETRTVNGWLSRIFSAQTIAILVAIPSSLLCAYEIFNRCSKKDVVVCAALMNYQDVVKVLNGEDKKAFTSAFPQLEYKETKINGIRTIVPNNASYINYFNHHYIYAPNMGEIPGPCDETHPCFLDIKVLNNSSKTLFLDKLVVDVDESLPDDTPFLGIYTCETYTSHIIFTNDSYSKWDGFDFEFTLLRSNEVFNGIYKFHTFVPYFATNYKLDLRPYIESMGFNYKRLLNETTARYEKDDLGDMIVLYDICETNLLHYKKFASPFLVDADGFNARLVGKISFRGNSFSVGVQAEIPLTTQAGFGGGENFFETPYDIMLKENGNNYQIEHPMSFSLKPHEVTRLALKLTAPKTSHHKLRIRLNNIGEVDVDSQVLSITIFKPKQ